MKFIVSKVEIAPKDQKYNLHDGYRVYIFKNLSNFPKNREKVWTKIRKNSDGSKRYILHAKTIYGRIFDIKEFNFKHNIAINTIPKLWELYDKIKDPTFKTNFCLYIVKDFDPDKHFLLLLKA